VDAFSVETPISVIENHSAINATRGRRGERRGEERRGEERRERGDQSDAYARHGLKGWSRGLCCDGSHLAVPHDM
jgi:hypothetical protein